MSACERIRREDVEGGRVRSLLLKLRYQQEERRLDTSESAFVVKREIREWSLRSSETSGEKKGSYLSNRSTRSG